MAAESTRSVDDQIAERVEELGDLAPVPFVGEPEVVVELGRCPVHHHLW